MHFPRIALLIWLLAMPAAALSAQAGAKPAPTVPRLPSHDLRGYTTPAEPEHPEPAATEFTDKRYGVSFHVPAGWEFERKDGILSNFGKETRSSRRQTDVRGVAAINFNPWPVTTFAGAMFYYSVLPHATAGLCAAQSTGKPMKTMPEAQISGLDFQHGRDQYGAVCTEARDEVFTAFRGDSCLRFDLVINTFCSETSGSMEINAAQLKDVQSRLAAILGSVKIER